MCENNWTERSVGVEQPRFSRTKLIETRTPFRAQQGGSYRCEANAVIENHHVDRPIRTSVVDNLVRRAGRLCRGLRGEAHDVSRRARGVRSRHRRRSLLCPRLCRQGARAIGTRGRGGGTRVDGVCQVSHSRSIRARSQPCCIFLLAGGGRRRRGTCRSARAPRRLST